MTDLETVEPDAETVEPDAPAVAFAVGDIVHVIERDGKKIPAIIVELAENAHKEMVAFVHRFKHDGEAIATTQTAKPAVRNEQGDIITPADPPVPVVQKVSV
jgi:hypothetical protein